MAVIFPETLVMHINQLGRAQQIFKAIFQGPKT